MQATPIKSETRYRDIVNHALHFTTEKAQFKNPEEAAEGLRQFDPVTHGYFRYAVAKKIMEILQAADPLIIAGYLVGESEERHVPHSEPLELVITVKRKTAALRSLVDDLAGGLLEEYQKIMGEAAKELQVFTYFELVDEEELKQRPRILAGTYVPPIEIKI